VSESEFRCLRSEGKTRVAVRAGCSDCEVDPDAKGTIANARRAGYSVEEIDIYIFPNFPCHRGAAGQVAQAIAEVGKDSFTKVWLDIEQAGSFWSKNYGANRAFLQDLINEADRLLGKGRTGIYSSPNGWQVAMGSEPGFPAYPLWFATYDGVANTNTFAPFAGWHSAVGKQFEGTTHICGVGVDVNVWLKKAGGDDKPVTPAKPSKPSKGGKRASKPKKGSKRSHPKPAPKARRHARRGRGSSKRHHRRAARHHTKRR